VGIHQEEEGGFTDKVVDLMCGNAELYIVNELETARRAEEVA